MSSVVSDRERELILDLLLDRIPENEFVQEFCARSGNSPADAGTRMLAQAFQSKDPVGVEFGLYLGHRFGFSPSSADVLCMLLTADWHSRHDDVIDGLSNLKYTACVDALYSAALSRHAYREYDESDSLGKKAIWALRKIESAHAIEALGAIMRGVNEALVTAARGRLEDIARAGVTESAREHAVRELASP